ncbi:hypothetical protein [Streptomyces albus]|uniref:hypothetical protein n=1 Tax=Streptomyces albus TaxID=1888 RepID=UPI003F1BD0CD
MTFYNPDFELYDNVGRTTEQIHAYNTNSPTNDDVHRWAASDAHDFARTAPQLSSGHSIRDWADHLETAQSVPELHTVTEAVLVDDGSALDMLSNILHMTAEWCDSNQQPEAARSYRKAADDLDQLRQRLAHLRTQHLAHFYTRQPSATEQHRPTPPAPAPRRSR